MQSLGLHKNEFISVYYASFLLFTLPHTMNGHGQFALVNIGNMDLCTVYLSFCTSGIKLCMPGCPAVLAWLC